MIKVGTRKDDIYLLIIFTLVIIIFYPVVDNFFLLDDTRWIKRGLELKKNISILYSPTEDGFLRPYLVILFWLVYPIFKLNASYYYILNISLHIINSVLIYFLACSIFKKYFSEYREVAFLSSLIFASLYSHYQAVVWIAAIPHLVSTLGFLCSTILFIKYFSEQKFVFLFFSLFFSTVAFLSRESTLALPLVLFILSFLVINSPSYGSFIKSIKFTLPYFILFLIHIAIYKYYVGFEFYHKNELSFLQFIKITFSCFEELILTSVGIIKIPGYESYIFKLIPLANISIIFLIFNFSAIKNIKSVLRIISALFLWTIITILPFVNPVIHTYGMFHRHRYLYLSSTGFSILFAGVIFYLYFFKKTKGKTFLLSVLASLVIFVNSYAIRIVERYYNGASLISYKIVEMVRNEKLPPTEKYNLVLIDFPHTPWVVFIPYHLEDLITLFFGEKWHIIRIEGKDIKSLIKGSPSFKNSIFLEYKNGIILKRKINHFI